MGTKHNPGTFNCLAAALDDEELFIFLARDASSPFVIGLWAAIRKGDYAAAQAMFKKEAKKLAQAFADEPDTDKADEAIRVANRMGAWRFHELRQADRQGIEPRWRRSPIEPSHLKDRPELDPSTFAGLAERIVNAVVERCECPEEGGSVGPAVDRAGALSDVKILLQGGVPGNEA